MSTTPLQRARWRICLSVLFALTLLNYVAQIPYYIHFYGKFGAAPSSLGSVLLGLTFIWFLVGFSYSWRNRRLGWWVLVGFLAVEFAFYVLHNLSGAFLKDLPVQDPIFLTVSLIGYLNTVVALVYLILLLRMRRYYFAAERKPAVIGKNA